jgi:hypothetical protein
LNPCSLRRCSPTVPSIFRIRRACQRVFPRLRRGQRRSDNAAIVIRYSIGREAGFNAWCTAL